MKSKEQLLITKDGIININFLSNNTQIFIIANYQINNTDYIISCNMNDLININCKFNQYNSINEIYKELLSFFNSKINNIEINYSEEILALQLNDFIKEETITLYLYKTLSVKRAFTTHNNKLIPITNNILNTSITNQINLNTDHSNYCSSNTLLPYIYVLLYILSITLIITLSLLCINYRDSSYSNEPSLIASRKEMTMISNWINPNYSFNYVLLYRASRDGDLSKDFHRYCDERGPTVTLVSSVDGWRFGGFTETNWTANSGPAFHESPKAFIFSLNLMKKYPPQSGRASILCKYAKGPTFGYGYDFSVENHSLSEESSCSAPTTFGNMNVNNEFCGGKKKFIAKEVEVYAVKVNGNDVLDLT